MPLTQAELDAMRLDDDGAPHTPDWQEVFETGPDHPRWVALKGLCARIIREVDTERTRT
jgi:hypothetical protein